MAYIPTIHTFEDDVNENRSFDDQPISGGVDRIVSEDSILVPEKKESSTAKTILILISIIFILASIGLVGYYFYKQYKEKQAIDLLNAQAIALQQAANQAIDTNTGGLSNTFPLLAPGISKFIDNFQKKNNIIILTIKQNTDTEDNYSSLYSYILAHKKDLGNDLISAFDLNSNTQNDHIVSFDDNASTSSTTNMTSSSTIKVSTSSKTKNNSSTTNTVNKVADLFDPEKLQDELSNTINSIAPQKIISSEDLVWETKTLNNEDFEISNAGIVTLIYGYAKNNQYLIFTTSVKDFLDTVEALN